MKKLLIFILVLLISLSFVNAVGIFSIIGVTNQLGQFVPGLQVPSELQELVNQVVCVSNPLSCAKGKIVGQLSSELYQALPPEIQKAYDTYNKINGYVQQGAKIVDKLQIQDGKITSGSIQFGQKGSENTVKFSGVLSPEVTKTSTGEQEMKLTFSGENSQICFEEKKTCYTNINEKTNSFIKLDPNGNINGAELTTSNKLANTPIVFGDQMVTVPPNTHVKYDGTKIIIYSDKETDFSISDYVEGGSTVPRNYKIIGNGNVVFTGTGLEVPPNMGVYNKDLQYSVMNNEKKTLFITDDPENAEIKLKIYDHWIIANKNSFQYNTLAKVELLPGNNWMTNVDKTNSMTLYLNGEGGISKNQLSISSGDVVSITSAKNCNSEITFTTQNVLLGKEHDVSCVPMSVSSQQGSYKYVANEDGSSDVRPCSQLPTFTSNSIFDTLTGRAIQWITGKATEDCTSSVGSEKVYYTCEACTTMSYTCEGGITKRTQKKSGSATLSDCLYTEEEIEGMKSLCEKYTTFAKTRTELRGKADTYCTISNQLKNNKKPVVLVPEADKNIEPELPQASPTIPTQPKKCSCLISCDSAYSTCLTRSTAIGNKQLCNDAKSRCDVKCTLEKGCYD